MITIKKFLKSLVSAIPFIIIGFCLLWTIQASYYETTLESLSSSMYSQNAYRFKLQNNEVDINWSTILSDDSIIYCDLDESSTLKGVYAGNNATFPIPIMEGNFFSQDDFQQNNNVAIVGKGRTDKLIYRNNKKYISIQNKEYEVIGVMGLDSVPSTVDYSILITLGNAKNILGNDLNFTLDGTNSSVEKSVDALQSSDIKIDKLTLKTIGLDKLYSSSYNSIFLYDCFSIIALLIFILFIYFEIYNKKSEMQIYNINGATKIQIAFHMLKKHMLNKYCGLVFGMILAFFILIYTTKTSF